METLDIVLPVFLVIGGGYFLRAIGFLNEAAATSLARLVFHVAAPVLLFRSAALAQLEWGQHFKTLGVCAAVTLLVAGGTYLAGRSAGPSRRGVLAQGSYRANLVFVGLPIVVFAYGPTVLGLAALFIGTMVVVYNIVAVLVLSLPHRDPEHPALRIWLETARSLAGNPLILGSAGGIAVNVAGQSLPLALDRALEMVGHIAMPLALLALGANLRVDHLRHKLRQTVAATVVKLAVYPALALLALGGIGASGLDLAVPVLMMASPTAVVSYVMAEGMDGDKQFAATIVIVTTLASVVTISLWLVLFRHLGA